MHSIRCFSSSLVLVLFVLISGCQTTSGPGKGPKASGTGALSSMDPKATLRTQSLISAANARQIGYLQGWVKSLEFNSAFTVTYLPKLHMIAVLQKSNNLVTAISSKTGEVLWDSLVGGRNDHFFGITHNKKFVVLNSDRKIFILDARNGIELFNRQLESTVATTPVVTESDAVFGSIDGLIFAHTLTTGGSRWRYRTRGGVMVSPVINKQKETIFFADRTGFYILMDNRKGEYLWQGTTNATITTQPIMGTSQVFVASEDHNLYSLRQIDGTDQPNWPYRTNYPLRKDPKLVDRYLFVEIEKRGQLVIDVLRKKDLWTASSKMLPLVMRGQSLVAWEGNAFQFYDVLTGRKINEVAVQPLKTVVQLDKGSLLLVSNECRLLRIDPIK